ncbi:MAG: hypothetical protein JXR59_02255 [Desulfuromonadaceae bacterium]|nr:hypothetical protein [Desulfuromonadaceae bacterium]
MANRAAVDRVFNAIIEQTAEEVSALLGEPLSLENHKTQLITKDQLFEISRNRSVLSTMVVSGDRTGDAFIITDQKDSITLGGTLIMLPADQIEENCKQRSFEGEAADAFGEVANIIAGVYTSIFLDMYSENLHFKRTTVTDFLPSRLDPSANEPFPPGEYFHSSCSMKLADQPLQKLEVIVPAEIFDLATPVETKAEEPQATAAKPAPPASAPAEKPADETAPPAVEAPAAEEASTPEPPSAPEPEPEQIKYVDLKTTDRTLKAALNQCAEELGTMLGFEIGLTGLTTSYTSKEEYFAKPSPKSVSTQMLVSGDSQGTSYLVIELKDAIYFGGTLIMLPEEELEKNIKAGKLEGENADAYAEVANIISGSLVQSFEEIFPRKLHIKRGDQDVFTPSKVNPDGPEPFPPGDYYSVCATFDCESQDLGRICYLVPVDVLHIPPRPQETGWGEAPPPAKDAKATTASDAETKTTQPASSTVAPGSTPRDVVIPVIYQNKQQADLCMETLQQCGHTPLGLDAKDDFSPLRRYEVHGAFLIMSNVDDQGFALLIKLRSEIPPNRPIIIGGPEWTRKDVLKAVRYGVQDILVTPATVDEVREKVENHLKTACH